MQYIAAMHHGFLFACTLLLIACGGRPLVNPAGIPVSLKQVTERYGQDHKIIKKTVTKRPKNIACGHSPACAIFLPFILFDMAFPSRYTRVEVSKEGSPVLDGTFTSGGKMITLVKYDSREKVYYSKLALRKLGKDIVIETGRQKTRGEFQATDIYNQYNFAAAYSAKLHKQEGKRKAGLMNEAFSLHRETDDFLLPVFKNSSEEESSVFLDLVCKKRANLVSGRLEKYLATKNHKGFLTLLEKSQCAVKLNKLNLVASWWQPLIRGACKSNRVYQKGYELLGIAKFFRKNTASALEPVTCPGKPGSFLRLVLKQKLNDKQVHSLVKDDDACARKSLFLLDFNNANHLDGVVRAIGAGSAIDYKLVNRLYRKRTTMAEKHCRSLALNFTMRHDVNLLADASQNQKRRAILLHWLKTCNAQKGVLQNALTSATDKKEKNLLKLALSVNGAPGYLQQVENPGSRLARWPQRVNSYKKLVNYGIYLAKKP